MLDLIHVSKTGLLEQMLVFPPFLATEMAPVFEISPYEKQGAVHLA